MNLTDLLIQQNNGAAVAELSQKFGLDQQQTVDAIEALMPAFSLGLKRNTRQPQGAVALVEALAHGQHSRYLDTPAFATSTAGIGDGNAILGHLFGTKDVSRAVAAQAAQSTGIGASILKKMLPAIASMVMGSLFKGAMGASRGGGGLGGTLGQSAGGGLLGSLLEGLAGGGLDGMLGGARRQPRRRTRSRTRRTQAPGSLEDLLGQMMGGGSRRPQRRQSQDPVMPPQRRRTQPGRGGGLGDIFDQLAGGSGRSTRRTNPYATQPQRRQAPRRRRGGLEGIFGDMLEPGGNSQPEYRRETGSVFDELLGPSQ